MQTNDEDRLLTRDEVAKRFGVSKRFLEVSAMRGEGPRRILLGRLVRYKVSDIRRWIDECAAPLSGQER
ncbi:helix-turn-helix domain-containing protein [Alisedimentitalea sp. MJ-SS2]|uniref:helix-turn-helix transcriptional regulator n=1 Tax=Aliisedimentitalea sp. MJ-SS2 TaxID=3049795 RepID=UPI00290D018D|nr:helix-turn-helix domain-containing protein [Alisedimentitalea sp. MJ-SS2]MDU8929672.1 helix-turn-helix domain-containing protein [Alisedimentitalea sp. MJ-SS2]